MAKNKKTFVPQPPIHQPIADLNRGGRINPAWINYFDAERRRSGGTYAISQKDLEDSNIGNAETIDDVKKSVEVLDKNVQVINKTAETIQKEVREIINNQNIDHESIVSAGKSIENINKELKTINEDLDKVKEKNKDIENKLNKVEVVSSLPTDETYINKFVLFSNELYLNVNKDWKKIPFSIV